MSNNHQLPESQSREYDYQFSNGQKYIHPNDRLFRPKYYNGFSERDKLLDDAITRGSELQFNANLWRIYDDALLNYELEPMNPYEWLFKHATLNKHSIILSIPHNRILLVRTAIGNEYYDFIHGSGAHFKRYSRPIE